MTSYSFKAVLLGSALVWGGAALAQETVTRGGLADIIVTASRQAENLQDTPIAVSAFSQTMLENRQVTGVRDISSQVPGLLIEPVTSTSASARIVLRGVGQENSGILFDPSVGIYIDNVYQPRVNAFFDFADVERIEVLRGPQGTLYGRNSSGGALKIITKKPSQDLTYSGEISVGSYNQLEVKAYVSGPIVPDVLAASLSYVDRRRDGFIEAPAYGKKVGDVDSSTLRGKLLFTPNAKLSLEAAVDYIVDRGEPGFGSSIQVRPGVDNPLANPGRNLYRTELSGPYDSSVDSVGASLNAVYEINNSLTLNSISGYRWMEMRNVVPFAEWPGSNLGGDWKAKNENFSQEINLTYESDRFTGVGGFYYFTEKGNKERGFTHTPNYNNNHFIIRKTEAYAGFVDGKLTVGEGVSLIAGLRYTREKAHLDQYYPTLSNEHQVERETFSSWTPKAGINWEIVPDVLVYAVYTKGFKSGGFNKVQPNQGVGRPVAYDPENVDSYELGLKATSADRRFRLNAAVFRADYQGMQLPVFFPGTGISFISNATGATIWGVELEPTFQLNDLIELYGVAAFTTGKYTDSFECTDGHGVRIDCISKSIKGLIPEQATVGVNVSPEFDFGNINFNAEWRYTSSYANNVSNDLPIAQAQKVGLFNASIRWTDPNNNWKVGLEVQNLFDKMYYKNALQISNPISPSVLAYPGNPRMVTLRAGFNF